jgi:site-specific recombinase XerD
MEFKGISSSDQLLIQRFKVKEKAAGKSLSTINWYENSLNHFLNETQMAVQDISRSDVMDWLNIYGENKTPRTVVQRVAILNSFFDFCTTKKDR